MLTFIAFILALIGALIEGKTASLMWGWFVVPMTGWHAMPTFQAIGIILLYRLLTSKRDDDGIEGMAAVKMVLGKCIIYPALCLGIAAIVHLFL